MSITSRAVVAVTLFMASQSSVNGQTVIPPVLPRFPADLGAPVSNIPKGQTGERLVAAWATNNLELAKQFNGSTTRAIPGNLNSKRNGYDVVVAILDDERKVVEWH